MRISQSVQNAHEGLLGIHKRFLSYLDQGGHSWLHLTLQELANYNRLHKLVNT